MSSKSKRQPKSCVINVRVTATQKKRLSERARELGLGLSSWLLTLGLRNLEAGKDAGSLAAPTLSDVLRASKIGSSGTDRTATHLGREVSIAENARAMLDRAATSALLRELRRRGCDELIPDEFVRESKKSGKKGSAR